LTSAKSLGRPVATFSLTRYPGAKPFFGALQMATHRRPLARTDGLRFWKLLGSGSGIGFSIRPDLRLWGLFAVWSSEDAWLSFRDRSRVARDLRVRGAETYTIVLDPVRSHGRWAGLDPFAGLPRAEPPAPDEPVVVLTRASIRPSRQLAFWRAVPAVDSTLRSNADLLLTFGFGEIPLARQGTLSVWRTAEAVRRWAYAGPEHAEVVRRTRDEAWYSEDLFARFRFRRSEGSFSGADPLAALDRTAVAPPRSVQL
jgi:hypothetical protein